jgi:hypothetical protein
MVPKLFLGAVAVLAVIVVALHHPTAALSSSPPSSVASSPAQPAGHATTADGVVPDGVTVFDDRYPAVTRLDPALLDALRRASRAAGLTFDVSSGWRSWAYQEQLFQKAVAQYGSAASAARWVARPGTSAHEAGKAVDLGPASATTWLSEHGAAYGLCQIYRNEPWHYELQPDAVGHGCPPLYADPTHDPRLQDAQQ